MVGSKGVSNGRNGVWYTRRRNFGPEVPETDDLVFLVMNMAFPLIGLEIGYYGKFANFF